jgi:hypothetical protein
MFRHLRDWDKSLFGQGFVLAALFFGFIFLILVVFRPIQETVILRYYYTPAEIERDSIHIERIIAKREIVFSNGEHRTYEATPKLLCTGIALGFLGLWLAVGWWACARLNRQSPSTGRESQGAVR